MSLIRQIWLLMFGTVLLAFLGSVTVAVESARTYLETQLQLKNADNATTLALALSQQKGDEQLMNLMMSAQFDTGFYRRIKFVAADGSVPFVREAQATGQQAPAWFVKLAPIESDPGIAQVSDGWRALGKVEVVSHSFFAHDELWWDRISERPVVNHTPGSDPSRHQPTRPMFSGTSSTPDAVSMSTAAIGASIWPSHVSGPPLRSTS